MTPKRRALFLIWLMMAVAYLDRVNISVAGPVMMRSLHLSHSQFGWVLSAFTLGYALMQIPGGALADRWGARGLLVAALVFWSVFTALTGAAGSLSALILIRVAFGLGEGLENGAQFKLIADYFPSRERSSANALFLTALALGPALASPLAAWLLTQAGWRGVFYWFSIPGLAVAALLWFTLPKTVNAAVSESPAAPSAGRSALRQPTSWLAFAAYLFFNVAFWGFLGWMPTYLSAARHIQLASLGLAAAIPYLCGFVGMLIVGWLGSQALVRRRALLIGICDLLAAVGLYLAYSGRSAAQSIGGLSFAAFFLYGGFGPFWAIAQDLIAEERRGAFTGFVNFGGQIGGFAAPLIVGALYDATHSFTDGFLCMIGALVLAAVSLFCLQYNSHV